MKKAKRSLKKGRIALICCLSFIFVITVTATAFYFVTYKGLKLDRYLGSLVTKRVANAQYLPDASLMTQSGVALLSGDSQSGLSVTRTMANTQAALGDMIEDVPELSEEEYAELVQWLGKIWTDDQAGTQNGFLNVTTVKDELYRVIALAPAFDAWFAEGGGIFNMFRGNGYRVRYDKAADRITVNCVSISTDTAIYNYDTQEIIKARAFTGPNLRQFTEIDYYYNEDGVEVVEMSIYSALLYKNKTYPISYQFIKNVRDTSFTKFYVLSNIRTRPTDFFERSEDNDYSPGAHDLENYSKYGAG